MSAPKSQLSLSGAIFKYSKLKRDSKALLTTAGEEFVFAGLKDRKAAPCWDRLAALIGFAGSVRQVERLLRYFKHARLGHWQPGDDFNDLLFHAASRAGLAIGAGRFPESTVLRDTVDHLAACSHPDFWDGDRSPQAPAWLKSERSAEARQSSMAEEQLIRCISALGLTGTERAEEFLEQFKASPMMRLGALQLRLDAAVRQSKALRRLGLDGYVSQHGYLQ